MNAILAQVELPVLGNDPKTWMMVIGGVLLTLIVGRFVQSFRSGEGLIGAAKAVIFGTNSKTEAQQEKSDAKKAGTDSSRLPIALLLCTGLLFLSGCKTPNTSKKQVLVKQTVFGVIVETSAGAGMSLTPNFKAGLIRTEYFSNPIFTDPVFYAPFTMKSSGKISTFSQSAAEVFSTSTNNIESIPISLLP